MTFQDLIPWIVGGQAILTFGTTVYTLLSTRGTKALAEIEAIKTSLKAQSDATVGRFQSAEARLLKIEADMAHLPDTGTAHRLELAVEKLNGQMATLDERLKPVAAIGERLQEFLLEQARK